MADTETPFDRERALINRLNSASVTELIGILTRPDPIDERTLRAHLGDARYERMHALALRRTATRGLAKLGNVVVIHGIMGGELTATAATSSDSSKIWLNYLQLALGRFMWLKLQQDGVHETDPRQSLSATGMIQKYYGELTLQLSETWNTVSFWYDWRKDIYRAAVELQQRVAEAFGRGAPFHIVAHSLGGLVARTFIRQNGAAWKTMQKGGAKLGGRLIMLGTPNFGSFAVPQIITGLEGIIRKLDLIDTRNDLQHYVAVANTFPGSYQMMPSQSAMPEMAPLYEANTWQPTDVPQPLLDLGRNFHKDIDPVKDDWMTYIAGYGQDTLNGVSDWKRLHNADGYTSTDWDGDGRVPHKLGLLGAGRVFYVREGHADLPTNVAVQMAAGRLLGMDPSDTLSVDTISDALPTSPARRGAAADPKSAAVQREASLAIEMRQLQALANRARGTRAMPESTDVPTQESARAEELLVAGWLGSGPEDQTAGSARGAVLTVDTPEETHASIEVAIYRGSIDTVHRLVDAPPDAIAVGLYVGVRPDGAARALDRSVSAAFGADDRERFLTQMLERGVIQAGLGQPFILPDPRTEGGAANRIIALAGMGIPGRFGAPEATVMSRELCWTLGRIGKRHLASILIGCGVGNLSILAATEAWLRGVARAQTGMPPEARLQRITFVESDKQRAGELKCALLGLKERLSLITVQYDGGLIESNDVVRRSPKGTRTNEVPARVAFTFDKAAAAYRFGSITQSAALPERIIQLDPAVVDEANQLLSSKETPVDQMTWGRFLERLLIPAEFRTELQREEPLVMMLDETTASIHWEMMAQPGFDDAGTDFDPNAFLGTARGLTRQLRTTFAPPPEPPPPVRSRVRVLLVADPDADAPLPGAQLEGARLSELLAEYNRLVPHNAIEIVTLFGPVQATRAQVLHQLVTRQFDVLHFAGHSFYDAKHPDRSGWIFGRDQLLTAQELNRIDRVPPFVFSNACESGVTPDRASKKLPQSFAEAFFGRGVTNFVCTAWPISDDAAAEFALHVYGALLGISKDEDTGQYQLELNHPMWEAMRSAREALAKPGANSSAGRMTWGAYQHYGNPYYRLITSDRPLARTKTATRPSKGNAKKVEKRSRRKR